jgi:hypothetical protein
MYANLKHGGLPQVDHSASIEVCPLNLLVHGPPP